jgi:hypothetical protein
MKGCSEWAAFFIDDLRQNHTNLQWATCNKQAGKAVLAIISAETTPQNLIKKGIKFSWPCTDLTAMRSNKTSRR